MVETTHLRIEKYYSVKNVWNHFAQFANRTTLNVWNHHLDDILLPKFWNLTYLPNGFLQKIVPTQKKPGLNWFFLLFLLVKRWDLKAHNFPGFLMLQKQELPHSIGELHHGSFSAQKLSFQV